MIYFEHYLREGGVTSLSSVVILAPANGEGACRDVADELLDLYPEASIRTVPESGPVPACDLLVQVFVSPWRFPFHDVVYEDLDRLVGLLRFRDACRSVMIFGASWRSVEVLASSQLPAFVRKRRREALLIRLLERSRLLRWLLHPLYEQT
jgi:hypothetical protein